MIRWFDELAAYRDYTRRLLSMRSVIEPFLAQREELEGYCCACNAVSTLRLPKPPAGQWADLRESFLCSCGLNGRMRMMYRAIVDAVATAGAAPRALIFERLTPLYAILAERFSFIEGCEYVAPGATPGSVHRVSGIDVRHEDMLSLSARDGSLDLIVHADVLEHVPEHRRALAECARALAPGGRMLFTCPFFALDEHIVRAEIVDGETVHHLPPGYHGNPLSSQGSLVFTHFGSPLFDEIREAGFNRARIGLLYDPFQGIVSNNNPFPDGFMWPVLFEGAR